MSLGKVILTAIISLSVMGQAHGQGVLSGDARLACEAILCLAAGSPPHECDPALRRYFSIHEDKPSDTIKARRRFLEKCPTANADREMRSLVNAIANAAGRCQVDALNRNTISTGGGDGAEIYISDRMPRYCTVYAEHAYTNVGATMPRYVGVPERGGYWVEAGQYEQALAQYEERIAREDAERERMSRMGDV